MKSDETICTCHCPAHDKPMSDEDYLALRFRMYMWSDEPEAHDQIIAIYGDRYTLAQAKQSGLSKIDPASFKIPSSKPRRYG